MFVIISIYNSNYVDLMEKVDYATKLTLKREIILLFPIICPLMVNITNRTIERQYDLLYWFVRYTEDF